MTSLSPESRRVPEMFRRFRDSGILGDLLRDTLFYHHPRQRDIVVDAHEIFGNLKFDYTGLENIPTRGGALLVFNHPDVQVVAPVIFSLPAILEKNIGRHDLAVMMGSELPFLGKIYFPGSPWLIRRLAGVYPDHFLLVPTAKTRSDYRPGRTKTRYEAVKRVSEGHLLAFAPEGQIGLDGAILSIDRFRHRSGDLGRTITILGLPVIPMGIWLDESGVIQTRIGPRFSVTQPGREGAIEMMANVAGQLPEHLRGPFRVQ